MLRIITLIAVEAIKFVRWTSALLILYGLVITILLSYLGIKKSDLPEMSAVLLYTTIKVNFLHIIYTCFPLAIIITINKEFSHKYDSYLISNGLPRESYFLGKYLLALFLSVVCSFLFLIIAWLYQFFSETQHINWPFLLISAFNILVVSLFVNSFILSIGFLVRSWQYSVAIYYGYIVTETLIASQFQDKLSIVEYLPIALSRAIVNFDIYKDSFTDLVKSYIILAILGCLMCIWALKNFKSRDL